MLTLNSTQTICEKPLKRHSKTSELTVYVYHPPEGSSGVAESRKKIPRSFFEATNSNCAGLCDGVRLQTIPAKPCRDLKGRRHPRSEPLLRRLELHIDVGRQLGNGKKGWFELMAQHLLRHLVCRGNHQYGVTPTEICRERYACTYLLPALPPIYPRSPPWPPAFSNAIAHRS